MEGFIGEREEGRACALDLLFLSVDLLVHHENTWVDVDWTGNASVEVGVVQPPL